MSSNNWEETRVQNSLHGKKARVWLIVGISWIIVASCCTSVLTRWDGRRHLSSYDAAVQGILNGPNKSVAIGQMQSLVLKAMELIREHESDTDRSGLLARNARDHFLKALER